MAWILTLRTWLIVSAVWAALMSLLCWETWPRLPLDSGTDPGTVAAHNSAVEFHAFQYATMGPLVPAALFVAGWLVIQLLKRRAQP